MTPLESADMVQLVKDRGGRLKVVPASPVPGVAANW